MKLKTLVGLSLIIFGSCVSLIMFVALILLPSTRVATAIDPKTGLPTAASDQSSGILVDGSGLTASNGQPSASASPKPGTTAAPSSANSSKTPTPAPATGSSVAKAPTAAPVAPPVVTAAPPAPVVYCGGAATCYGRSSMAAHASVGNCWAYINTTIYNMTNFGGTHSGGRSVVENSGICGGNALAALNAAPTNSKHNSAKNNTQGTLLNFKVGTYDPNKP